jgi:hypothetical protein
MYAGGGDGPTPLRIGLPLAVVSSIAIWTLLGHLIVSLVSQQVLGEIFLTPQHADIRDQGTRHVIDRDQVTAVAPMLMPCLDWGISLSGRWPVMRRVRPLKTDLVTPHGRVRMLGDWGSPEAKWIATVMQIWSDRPLQPVHDLAREPIDDPAYCERRAHRIHVVGYCLAALLLCIAGGFIAGVVVPGLSSDTWPATRGHMIRSEMSESRDNRTRHIEYAYRVEGSDYHSDRLGYLRDLDDDFITGHPKGSGVAVYYDPHRPQRSVLVRGISPFGWCLIGVVTLGVLPGLLTAWSLARYPVSMSLAPLAAYRVPMPMPPSARPRGDRKSPDLLRHLPSRTKIWAVRIGRLSYIGGGICVVVLFVKLAQEARSATDYHALQRAIEQCIAAILVWLGVLLLWFAVVMFLNRRHGRKL